jgi:LysM repeat protein
MKRIFISLIFVSVFAIASAGILSIPVMAQGGGAGSRNDAFTTYVVQQGDTLTSIAQRFGTTWQVLAQFNNIADPSLLYVGQVLNIPNPGPAPAQAKRITFAAGGTSAVMQGSVAPNGVDRYVLRALVGQTLTVTIVSPQTDVIVEVWGADGTVLISDHAGATNWTSSALPTTQDYYIDAQATGAAQAAYTLTVIAPPSQPEPASKRITFQAGTFATALPGTLGNNGVDRYILKALGGQSMTVSVAATQGFVALSVWGADGTVLISDHASATNWTGKLPSTQDYLIAVKAEGGGTPYTLQVSIPPR